MSLAKRILGAFIEVEEDKEEGITTLAANTEAKTNIATDRKSTRLNSSHRNTSRMPSSA